MKKLINLSTLITGKSLFLLFALCIFKISNAQQNKRNDSLNLRTRIYKANVLINNSKKTIRGYLAGLSDSELQFSSSPIVFSSNNKNNFTSAYNYAHLKKVIIWRKGAVGRSAGRGALIGTGFMLGTIGVIYAVNSSDIRLGFLALASPFAGSLIGVIVGAISHQMFIINGNKNKYHLMRESIFNKLLHNHSGQNNDEQYYPPSL